MTFFDGSKRRNGIVQFDSQVAPQSVENVRVQRALLAVISSQTNWRLIGVPSWWSVRWKVPTPSTKLPVSGVESGFAVHAQ